MVRVDGDGSLRCGNDRDETVLSSPGSAPAAADPRFEPAWQVLRSSSTTAPLLRWRRHRRRDDHGLLLAHVHADHGLLEAGDELSVPRVNWIGCRS